jgi:hypothetical protein
VLTNAPEPDLTSYRRWAAPVAAFLETMEEPMRGSESTVPVVSLRA